MLSKTATYALQAMAFLADHRDEGPVLSQTISQEMKIPKNFLSKILNRLVQKGSLNQSEGPEEASFLRKIHQRSACVRWFRLS